MSVLFRVGFYECWKQISQHNVCFLSLLHCWLSGWLLWVEFEASHSLMFWMFSVCLGSCFEDCGTFKELSLVGRSIWAESNVAWPAFYVSRSATVWTSYHSLVLPPKRELSCHPSLLWRVEISGKPSSNQYFLPYVVSARYLLTAMPK